MASTVCAAGSFWVRIAKILLTERRFGGDHAVSLPQSSGRVYRTYSGHNPARQSIKSCASANSPSSRCM